MYAVSEGIKFGHHKIVFNLWLRESVTIDDDFVCGKGQPDFLDKGDIVDFVPCEFMFIEEVIFNFGDTAFDVGSFAFETE